MKQLAFYAPLKSPEHPVPSGDRQIAQGIMNALSMNSLDLKLSAVSQLRCYDGQGSAAAQQKIRAQAKAEVERLLERAENLQAWVTYHNYYKAPDLVGFAVSQRLKIPYLLIEASIAKSCLHGPWYVFAASDNVADVPSELAILLEEYVSIAHVINP